MERFDIYEFSREYPDIVLEIQSIVKTMTSVDKSAVKKIRRILSKKYHPDQKKFNGDLLAVVNNFCDELNRGDYKNLLDNLMNIDLSIYMTKKKAYQDKVNKFKNKLNEYYVIVTKNRVYVSDEIIEGIYLMMKDVLIQIDSCSKIEDVEVLFDKFLDDVKSKYDIDLNSNISFAEQLKNKDNVYNKDKMNTEDSNKSDGVKNKKFNSDDYFYKESLLKKLIISTMIKYNKKKNNLSEGVLLLGDFIKNDRLPVVSDDLQFKNLCDEVKSNLSSFDIGLIVDNSVSFGDNNLNYYGITNKLTNYIFIVMLNYVIECLEKRFPGCSCNNINGYIRDGELTYITESVGKARTVAKNLPGDLIKYLFKGMGVNDIFEYYQKVYNGNDRERSSRC